MEACTIKYTFNMHIAFTVLAPLGISVTQRLRTTHASTAKHQWLAFASPFTPSTVR